MRIVLFIMLMTLHFAVLHGQTPLMMEPIPTGEDTIYTKDGVDNLPVFPGGEEAMYKMVYTNMKYPRDAREGGISGTCILSFIIEKDGSISDPHLTQHVFPSIDTEVMRISKYFDVRWQPALKNGFPVRYAYSTPLRFVLQ